MHFPVDMQLSALPALLSRLIAITGAAAWTQREKDFSRQIAQNPVISRYLDIQFALERAMIHARRHVANTGRLPSILDPAAPNSLGALYSFAAMLAGVFGRLPPNAQNSLRRRLSGALRDNIGLAPLAFEMRTATHFMAAGFDVEFSDLCEGGGFDLLARNKKIEIEIECKSASGDLGRQIHLVRQYQLGPHLTSTMTSHRKVGSVQLIIAMLPGRLHGQRDFMTSVANRIREGIETRESYPDYHPCSVTYNDFSIVDSPFDCTTPFQIDDFAVADYFKRVVNEDVGHTIMTVSPRRSATVVALRSATPDKFLRALHRNLREAAASQLSGTRPGIICVQFRNLTAAQLREVAAAPMQTGKPNGLQLMTADFFAGEGRRHVHTLAYTAPGEFSGNRSYQLGPGGAFLVRNTVIGEDAGSYTFTNKKHPQAEAPEYQVFDRPKRRGKLS
jgi:hypothetical protein